MISILTILIVGAIVGWLAAVITGRNDGLLASILIGIFGAIIGGWVSRLFTGSDQAFLAFDWTGFFWSLAGAVILSMTLNSFHRTRTNV